MVLAFVVMLCLGTGIFADDISFGAGFSGAYSIYDQSVSNSGGSLANVVSTFPIDVKAFVDFGFLELSLGYLMAFGGTNSVVLNGSFSANQHYGQSSSAVSISLLLKMPIPVGSFTLFPLFGWEGDLNITQRDSTSGADLKPAMTDEQQSGLNEVWLKAGFGTDFPLGQFFLRAELLAGIKINSDYELQSMELFQSAGVNAYFLGFTFDLNLLFGMKL